MTTTKDARLLNGIASLFADEDEDMTLDEAKGILSEHGYDPDQVAKWGREVADVALARASQIVHADKWDNIVAVRVSQELLSEMMRQGWKTEGVIECLHGVPPDAEFVTAEIEPRAGYAVYIFRHPDFPSVQWEEAPLMNVIFSRSISE